jgi:anthranilate phosphoribosyltransferase
LRRHSIDAIIGGEASDNAAIIRSIMTGQEQGAYRDVVLANAGACIYMGGAAVTLAEGVQQAAAMIDSGKALAKLEQLIQTTGELGHVS